jgi:hypothetical protein
MKTVHTLYHWGAGRVYCDDDSPNYATAQLAMSAAGHPDETEWLPSLDDLGYHRPSDWSTDVERWAITPTQLAENDADRIELALDVLVRYGQIDGDHNKLWAIDQAVRVLAGDRYEQIIAEACEGEDGPDTYDWNTGVAP